MLMMSDATGKRAQLALFSSAVASSLISSIATHRRRANRSAPFPRWMELGRTAARLLKCGNIFGETEPGPGRGPRCTEYGACNGKKASFPGLGSIVVTVTAIPSDTAFLSNYILS